MEFHEIAQAPARANAVVFEHGWQSWSPAGSYPASGRSSRPGDRVHHIMGYRPEQSAPEDGFQGEGLLALDLGNGEPVRVWSAVDPRREVPSIRLTTQADQLVISANGEMREETFVGTMEQALSRWAEGLARRLGVASIKSLPPIWCTWYYYFTSVSEADVLENLAAMDRLGLAVGVVQLDDGYQAGIGDWLDRQASFPRPLGELTARIRDTGRRAGIWTAPFLVGAESHLAREHPDWLVGDADAGYNWFQSLAALDVTHPDAAAYLQDVFRSFARDGFDFFKLDFLYAGALPGRRHMPSEPLEAYREGLRLIREAVGEQATLLGCGAPLLPSIGLVEAMRVSPDITPSGIEPPEGDLSQPAQHSAVAAGKARAFQHARWWVNDPDCLIARPGVEEREAWAAHIERYGGLRGSSDRLEALDAWGLETTRHLLRPSSPQPLIS
ncbi:MAG TPA: glycoside hydrolase family 36 protein [Ktedonobacterales bacterium]